MNLQQRVLQPAQYEQKPILIPEGLRYSQQPSAEKPLKKASRKPTSSELHSEDKAKKSQSTTKYLKTHCYYHPNQIITNFCSNPECLMPLCPVCIEFHQKEHNAKKELSTFEPIDQVQSKSLAEILNLIEDTKNLQFVVQSVQSKYQEQNQTLMEKINYFKMEIMQIVEQFFNQFTKQILDDCYKSEKSFKNAAKFVLQQLDSIMNELVESKEEIVTPEKMLKVIIQMQSTNYYNQTKDYLSRKQREFLLAQDSMIEANLDQSKLNQIPVLLDEIVKEMISSELETSPQRALQDLPPKEKEISPKSEVPSKSIAFQQSDIYSPQQSNKQAFAEQSQQIPQFVQKNQPQQEQYLNQMAFEQNRQQEQKQLKQSKKSNFNQETFEQQQLMIQQQMIALQQQQALARQQMLKQQYYEETQNARQPQQFAEHPIQQQNYYSQRYQQPMSSNQKPILRSPEYQRQDYQQQSPLMKYQYELMPRQNQQQWNMTFRDPKRSYGYYKNSQQYF